MLAEKKLFVSQYEQMLVERKIRWNLTVSFAHRTVQNEYLMYRLYHSDTEKYTQFYEFRTFLS